MKEEEINRLIKEKRIRKRSVDREKIKSLVASSKSNAEVALSIPLNEKNSTVIFREIYESIRQLGDAAWWLDGCEPLDHDISLEILKNLKIKNSVELNFLDRFRKIRNDANYRGFKVTEFQAKEILSFWNKNGSEILRLITII
jgi:hypothetical protein